MKRLIRLLLSAVGLLVVIAGVCVVRTLLATPRELYVPPAAEFDLDSFALSKRLARAIRIGTVSYPGAFDRAAFASLEAELERTFKRAHQVLELEAVGERARLYRFVGKNPELPPAILLAHLDVVPVEADTREQWSRDPFGGELVSGFVWGRGTLDDKGSAVALLEAVEVLARRGRGPQRDVYLAFGYDEELGGEGAREVAALLAERGIEPLLVLDEGMFVLDGVMPGLDAPLAAIGVAEKGGLLLELTVEMQGGHAALVPAETAVGVLARAIERLELAPLPSELDPPFSLMLERVAPRLEFLPRLVLVNTWLTAPWVRAQMKSSPATAASMRTSTAVTIVEAGVAPNVVPGRARALVDLRVHPRDTLEEVLERVRRIVGDERIEIEVLESRPPTAISPASGEAYELIERTILQVFPDACVAPALCIAGTDARHYAGLTSNVYRFLPLKLVNEDLARIHGINERIELSAYGEMVRFYAQLFTNL